MCRVEDTNTFDEPPDSRCRVHKVNIPICYIKVLPQLPSGMNIVQLDDHLLYQQDLCNRQRRGDKFWRFRLLYKAIFFYHLHVDDM